MKKTQSLLTCIAATALACFLAEPLPAATGASLEKGSDPKKILIDTDIGEDIDDILVTAFALISPEFEVLGITTVDGDVEARSRIARRVTQLVEASDIPVSWGYRRPLPQGNGPWTGKGGLTQGDLASAEEGLPKPSPLRADELMAQLAERFRGELTIVTFGSLTNVGQFLVRYPDSARHLRGIVTNGGNFDDESSSIGWNLRYDPAAAAVLLRSGVPWVLLSESAFSDGALDGGHVRKLESADSPLAHLLASAIRLWRKNKPDASRYPHLSDFNTLAYLMNPESLEVVSGDVFLEVGPPGALPRFSWKSGPKGRLLLGTHVFPEEAVRMRELLMERILGFRRSGSASQVH